MMIRKLGGQGIFFYWQFAALNFTLLLLLGALGWKLDYLNYSKLKQMKTIVMTLTEGETPKEKLTDVEYEKLKTEEERSRWINSGLKSVLKLRQEALLQAAQKKSVIEQEKGVLEAERKRLEALRKTLSEQDKAFLAQRDAWAKAEQDTGYLKLVERLIAMDDTTKVSAILLVYPPEKIALFLTSFSKEYAGEVISAMKDTLDQKGKLPVLKEILTALERRRAPEASK